MYSSHGFEEDMCLLMINDCLMKDHKIIFELQNLNFFETFKVKALWAQTCQSNIDIIPPRLLQFFRLGRQVMGTKFYSKKDYHDRALQIIKIVGVRR